MNKKIKFLILLSFLFTGCSSNDNQQENKTYLINGGFESSDLSGWTILSGDAFDDDSVSSRRSFEFSYDESHNQIPINHTGNWYLSGKGYDLKKSNSRTGELKSSNFILNGDGTISMKLAGGALSSSRGVNAALKDKEKICYVGVYLTENEQMIAQFKNEYFLEETDSYVDVNKYNLGVYNTDNFYEYSIDLSNYLNEEMYIKIVDNDQSSYYGYISVDDIRIGGEEAQTEGEFFIKTKSYVEEAEAKNKYEIINGDFELGSLAGWEIVSGDAFSNEGVNSESVWWNENISYEREGKYHYGFYNPSATGVMRSSNFELGGSGYISYKLGGCANNELTYLRFMLKKDSGDQEIARISNYKYWNFQFPYVENGMRLLNMNQYYINLSKYIGETLYIEVVDNNSSTDDLGCITLDSIKTYYETEPVWYDIENYEVNIDDFMDVELDNEYQVKNGTFETGDLSYWTPSWEDENDRIGYVSDENTWWAEQLPYNKKGRYLFTGVNDESKTGKLTSLPFTIGGTGIITFKMGGAKNPKLVYLSVVDDTTNVEIARFSNSMFNDLGISTINNGSNLLNMTQYKADLSKYLNRKVRLEIVDNASNDWGLIAIDSIITYYPSSNGLPKNCISAIDCLEKEAIGLNNEYQVLNGDFETGDLTGWTLNGGNFINISFKRVWWIENYLFDKQGTYFLNGWESNENETGYIESEEFTLGGIGKITFKLGGGHNQDLCYVELIDAETNEVIGKYGNSKFKDLNKKYFYNGLFNDLSKDGYYLANMATYQVDLSNYLNRKIKIRLVDNATSDWGLLFADDFITYYESNDDLPSSFEAINII